MDPRTRADTRQRHKTFGRCRRRLGLQQNHPVSYHPLSPRTPLLCSKQHTILMCLSRRLAEVEEDSWHGRAGFRAGSWRAGMRPLRRHAGHTHSTRKLVDSMQLSQSCALDNLSRLLGSGMAI